MAARSYSLKVRPGHFCARLCWPPAASPGDGRLASRSMTRGWCRTTKAHRAAGARRVASDGCIEKQTEDGNHESEKYGRPSWVVGPSPARDSRRHRVHSFLTPHGPRLPLSKLGTRAALSATWIAGAPDWARVTAQATSGRSGRSSGRATRSNPPKPVVGCDPFPSRPLDSGRPACRGYVRLYSSLSSRSTAEEHA